MNEIFIIHYPNAKIYKNVKYVYNSKQYEIDTVIEYKNTILIVESKSGRYNDSNKALTELEFNKELKDSFGKGFITLNNAILFSKTPNSKFKKDKTIIKLKDKQIIPLLITLSSLDSKSGSIQKLEGVPSLDYYPVNFNISDLDTILNLINFTQIPEEPFTNYLIEKYCLTNNSKLVNIDIDEVDAFGYITSPKYERMKSLYTKTSANTSMIIGNSIYRKTTNREFDSRFFGYFVEERLPEISQDLLSKTLNKQ